MATHAEARTWAEAGTKAALGHAPTYNQVLFVQAIALLESGYGAGWKSDGVGSWNMGAVQAGSPPCDPADSFLYQDSHPNDDGTSTKYEWCYKKYPTPEAGMQDIANILYNRMKVKPTSIEAVSTQMYDKHYYEGFGATREARIAGHVKALTRGLERITTALDEPMPPATGSSTVETSDSGGAVLIGLGLTAALVSWGLVAIRR